jgi:hypothetical protein
MRRSAGALVLTALVVAAAGCGGGDKADRRHAIDEYFGKVNAVATRHAAAFRAANAAFRTFSGKKRPADESARLAKAAHTIRVAGAETAKVDPPADAAPIHANILTLYRREAALAGELVKLDAFLPRARTNLVALRAASLALRKQVSATGAAAQIDALRAYGTRVRTVANGLAALEAPAMLVPWRAEQLRWLRAVGPTARSLGNALAARDRVASEQLIKRLRLQLARPPRTSQAQREASAAFNREVAAIARLSRKIDLQRARLERRLR